MATSYLTPGVYVEEVPAQSKPIEGVSTSVAAFVGLAPGGPTNTPMRISNFTQFSRIFGDPSAPERGAFMDGAYLAHAVYGFFQNGGSLCWVVRVGAGDGEAPAPVAALPAAADLSVESYRAVARPEITAPVTVEIDEEPAAKGDDDKPAETTYRIVVTAGDDREEHTGLSLKKGRTNLATKVNASSKIIIVEDTGASLPETQRVPALGTYQLAAPAPTSSDLDASEFEGDVARRQGIGGLVAIDEISIVCVPDAVNLIGENGDDTLLRDVQGKIIAHCESTGDRMVILDTPDGLLPQEVLEWRQDTAGYDSKFAALYWPWIEVIDPLTKRPLAVPPSGHVAGAWARTDAQRGVHKAPANEVVMGANSLAFQITSAEQGALNKAGINCIRSFTGRGIRIWGARTLSSDPEWRYINVRRLFNYVSQSVMEGTQWSVFEPNDERLWMKLQVSVSNFLNRTWRSGALFGTSESQAFFVKCDAETNPPDSIEAGQVVCEIGISPVKPAEFVIFRLSQFADGGGDDGGDE
ncbi:phage tail sheath family protein [Conexibacter sp. W3-3-2]|uniref:Phage tail protein n=1 Tax=Paraconexibacter algicola TaxID=2133960 RepID=A0A2T4UGF9_9ACTN|nr:MULTISPECIES: phage tail sheath subtilisin-like domain-containing protein [Solirubrobacterales]MTD44547.1 phage tail sheath family protein [Conexibacter sp. W3-3-2]PTL58295.1 phage tail protein [Paraconexibacter algicola]